MIKQFEFVIWSYYLLNSFYYFSFFRFWVRLKIRFKNLWNTTFDIKSISWNFLYFTYLFSFLSNSRLICIIIFSTKRIFFFNFFNRSAVNMYLTTQTNRNFWCLIIINLIYVIWVKFALYIIFEFNGCLKNFN